MPRRPLITAMLLLIIIVSLVMVISGSLNGAAAWANIIALPVAIISMILTLGGVSHRTPVTKSRSRNPAGKLEIQDGEAASVNQIGFGGVRQANVAGNYFERDHDDRESR